MNNFESLQTGSVRKKGSQWYYRFRIKDQDGNWKMHEFKGGQTKAETTFMLKQALEEYRQDGSILCWFLNRRTACRYVVQCRN